MFPIQAALFGGKNFPCLHIGHQEQDGKFIPLAGILFLRLLHQFLFRQLHLARKWSVTQK
jgi:hypothetical protein